MLKATAVLAILRGGSLAALPWLTRAMELSGQARGALPASGKPAFIVDHVGPLPSNRQLARHEAESGTAQSPTTVVAPAYAALYEDAE